MRNNHCWFDERSKVLVFRGRKTGGWITFRAAARWEPFGADFFPQATIIHKINDIHTHKNVDKDALKVYYGARLKLTSPGITR